MEANRSRARWTWAEYARLPTSGSTRYEVIDGELAVTPSPTSRHQRILAELIRTLGNFVRAHDVGVLFPGPMDVLFAEGDYVQPDLVFVRKDREHLIGDRGIEGPPDLVVEILSPSTAHRDRGVKLERYRHYGVPEYWIVDPEARAIERWRLGEGAEVVGAGGGAEAPEVVGAGEGLVWCPVEGGATLEVEVREILPEP